MVNAFFAQPLPSFMAFVIVATGVLAFWIWRRLVPLPGGLAVRPVRNSTYGP